jgi:peptidyl-tRNA hydrolase
MWKILILIELVSKYEKYGCDALFLADQLDCCVPNNVGFLTAIRELQLKGLIRSAAKPDPAVPTGRLAIGISPEKRDDVEDYILDRIEHEQKLHKVIPSFDPDFDQALKEIGDSKSKMVGTWITGILRSSAQDIAKDQVKKFVTDKLPGIIMGATPHLISMISRTLGM